METRVCKTCKEAKPHSEFYKHLTGKHELLNHCKPCKRNLTNILKRMQIGYKNFKTAHCECCGVSDAKIQIDHCHSSNKFRGFVCQSCNLSLASLGDNYTSLVEKDAEEMYIKYMRTAYYRMGETI
jgi:hypothetical protein